ncbi:phosphatase PAP2 family protein [Chishuiella sp.]|uniref:phosphatase PAP2 family protein n=1 Tax=Chishuiella sp. TaxID=1969467 RepID=UPI0028B07B8C|nr:phosphatase PAP2 family protein [Chishuiella sp.]
MNNALSISNSLELQKELFLKINHRFSNHPNILNNLALDNFTQFGDAFTLMSFLTIFILYASRLWKGLITSSLVSFVFCFSLKKLFKYPRPATVFDNDSFTIVGKTLTAQNSLPSGHSITVFVIFTIILYAFMPQNQLKKIVWTLFILFFGLFLASTRIGVGAHFPLDVAVGSIVGYICGVMGIIINNKFNLWRCISNQKHYPYIILILLISIIITSIKIIHQGLFVYYLSLISLFISLVLIIKHYVKSQSKITNFYINNKLS